MTKAAFEKVVQLVADAYGKPLTARELASWYGLLVPIPDDAGLKAAVAICRESPVRPSLAVMYHRAQDFIRPVPPPVVPSLPPPPPSPEVQALAAQVGRHQPPANAIAVEMAVEILAEKIRGATPGIHGHALYRPICAAILGYGPYADLWALLRGRPRVTSEGASDARSDPVPAA